MITKQMIENWVKTALLRRNPATMRTYRSLVSGFASFVKEGPLNPETIEDYLADRRDKELKSTTNVRIAAIKAFFEWYTPRHGGQEVAAHLKMFPASDVKPQKQRFLTDAEYGKILNATDPGIERDTVELLANTGLRRSEYCRLSIVSITPEGTHFKIRGKGDKDRKVPINRRVNEIVRANTRDDGTLTCVTYWKDPQYIWERCQTIARKAGIPAFGPHAFRHYFATSLIRKGVPLKMVSMILGHSSVTITESIYCHLTMQDTTGLTECLC